MQGLLVACRKLAITVSDMKIHIILSTIALALLPIHAMAQDGEPEEVPGLPEGMNTSFTIHKGKIIKVYSAEEKGASFRAYVVKWKEQEVIVSDPLSDGKKKKEGDSIRFMAQRIEIEDEDGKMKMLQFMLIDL